MRLRGATLVAVLVAGAAWTGASWSAPAGAAVTVTSSGTTVTVNATAGSAVSVTCTSGQVRAQGIAPSPPVSCAAATTITILGDGGSNYINVRALGSAFPNLGNVVISPGGGSNLIFGSPKRDTVLGSNGGQDQVWLDASGVPDGGVSLGSNSNDTVNVEGTSGSDTITVASGSPATRTDITRGTWTVPVTGTRFIGIAAGEGDDVVDASTLGDSVVLGFSATGGLGNDTLRGGTPTNVLSGGPGTNSLAGGPKADTITTEGAADTIEGKGGADTIFDQGSGPAGARTFVAPTSANDLWVLRADGDAAVRTRSNGDGTVRVSSALARSGIQELGPGVSWITFQPDGTGLPSDRVVLDIAALPDHAQRITSSSPGTIVDLVVPSGSWSRSGGTVGFSGPYEDVIVGTGTTVGIRAPFTDPEERFAHRVLRDMEMRLPTAAERASFRGPLESGDLTREDLAALLTSTDTFRGLAVDRAFIDILRRGTDAAGRAYWVGRLRSGLITRKLRANLYGSPEYASTQGGGTVVGYVTSAYRDILGREPEAGGLDYWIDLIESGTPRGTVAERFLATSEARTVIVRDLFLRWVDREPTGSEMTTWRNQLSSTTNDGEVALIRFLAASRAYFNAPDA